MPKFRLSIVLAVLVLAGLGCSGKKEGATPTKESKPNDTGTPTLPSSAGVNNDEAKAAALKSATEFVKAVQEGKATSASLTVPFKKVIAPPELDADKEVGYSQSDVQSWLNSAKSTVVADELKVAFATADFAIASTDPKPAATPKLGKTYLRMIRSNKTWLIDYAIVNSSVPFFSIPNNDQAAIAFAALAFGEALAVRNDAAIEILLSKSAKAKLAPPAFDTDHAQGYSKSKLKSELTYLFPKNPIFKGLSVTGNIAKADVQVEGGSGPLSYKLIPGTYPGEYLVDDFPLK